MALSRRAFLQGSGALGAAGLAHQETPAQARITRRFIVPRAEQFEENYVGQWLQVISPTEGQADVIDACEFADWSADETQAYDALLLDRRSEAGDTVELTAYGNGTKETIQQSTVFIVNDIVSCDDEYVGLDVETAPRSAVAGKPAGPTVTETDGQPGFSLLAAVVAVLIGAAAQARRSGRD